jgi:peptidyl-prolyl cis-trans isomerase A (cyclophilin A)
MKPCAGNEWEKTMKTLKKTGFAVSAMALVVLGMFGERTRLSSAPVGVTCCITTTEGEILVQVSPEKAPVTAANFLRYVEAGLYDGSSFFRVVTPDNQPNDKVRIEVIQGGDVADDKCFPPIVHETTQLTGLRHLDGTVSMARAEPGTATCSFFICVGDQPDLDFGGRRNPDGQGFAAFGRVLKGMEVVRRIQQRDQEKQLLKKPVAIISIKNLGSEVEK